MDISETLAPKSDQIDFDDFAAGDRTFVVTEVRRGPSVEQPVEIHFSEFPRPWRPSKSMRRVLVAAWGADASTYVGKRMALFGDPTVKFGGQAVGGIRIRALSGIDAPLSVSLTVTRGKRAPFTVQPLLEATQPAPAPDKVQAALTAIAKAQTLEKLVEIEAYAKTIGILDAPGFAAAIDAKRDEIEPPAEVRVRGS